MALGDTAPTLACGAVLKGWWDALPPFQGCQPPRSLQPCLPIRSRGRISVGTEEAIEVLPDHED